MKLQFFARTQPVTTRVQASVSTAHLPLPKAEEVDDFKPKLQKLLTPPYGIEMIHDGQHHGICVILPSAASRDTARDTLMRQPGAKNETDNRAYQFFKKRRHDPEGVILSLPYSDEQSTKRVPIVLEFMAEYA